MLPYIVRGIGDILFRNRFFARSLSELSRQEIATESIGDNREEETDSKGILAGCRPTNNPEKQMFTKLSHNEEIGRLQCEP